MIDEREIVFKCVDLAPIFCFDGKIYCEDAVCIDGKMYLDGKELTREFLFS